MVFLRELSIFFLFFISFVHILVSNERARYVHFILLFLFAFWLCGNVRISRAHNHNFNLCSVVILSFSFGLVFAFILCLRSGVLGYKCIWLLCVFVFFLSFFRAVSLIFVDYCCCCFVNKSQALRFRSVRTRQSLHLSDTCTLCAPVFICNWPLLHSHWCFHIQITQNRKINYSFYSKMLSSTYISKAKKKQHTHTITLTLNRILIRG